MEYILLAVIVLQFAYSVYKDYLYSKERENLRKMIKSKNLDEYSRATEKPEELVIEKQQDEYIAIEEVPVDRIINAEDKL